MAKAKRQPLNSYQPALYRSPIDLPESKQGNISITHRIEKGRVAIIGVRQAYTRGVTPVMADLKGVPLRIHELHEKGHGLWMTDLPEELNQIGEMLHLAKPQGNVLVGGLGLGILTRTLAARSGVGRVVTVERSQNIIDLVLPKGDASVVTQKLRADTYCDDILHFLKTSPHAGPFDYYLLDTWQGTNEMTWWGHVLPLRRAIRNRFGAKPVVHCWAEDIMLGQVGKRLRVVPKEHAHWYYHASLLGMSEKQIQFFLQKIGTAKWERQYGVTITAVQAKLNI